MGSSARLGAICRGDQGGMSTMTWEFARHMKPDAVLLVDPHGRSTRGRTRTERYDEFDTWIVEGTRLTVNSIRWLLDRSDVIYTVETAYDPSFWHRARDKRTILHAMPELYESGAKEVWLPTEWERDRIPEGKLVPVPIATDRIPARHVKEVRTWFHPVSNAMKDRSGTEILFQALQYIKTECKLVLQSMHPISREAQLPPWRESPNVEIERIGETENYWEPYCREDIDALVLPRRFSGLNLPLHQSLAAGWPVVTLANEPTVILKELLVPSFVGIKREPMKGGLFDIYDADPKELARVMDRVMQDDDLAQRASMEANDFASELSWDNQLPNYNRLIRGTQ